MSGMAASSSAWSPIEPARAGLLVDARLQLHHAAQLGAALGISYLEKQPDDSHTNFEWLPSICALASNRAGEEKIRVAARPAPLAILIVGDGDNVLAEFPLHGRTLEAAVDWVRARLAEHQLDPSTYTMKRHYVIPPHAVEGSAPFDATDAAAFGELARWYDDAASYFTDLAARVRNPSPVRCWPHHFDIGMLFEPSEGHSIGVGLEPGDGYYAEPYWYANSYPPPSAVDRLPSLDGGGMWHTSEWTGAVLTGSRLTDADQHTQVARFFDSAFRAYDAASA